MKLKLFCDLLVSMIDVFWGRSSNLTEFSSLFPDHFSALGANIATISHSSRSNPKSGGGPIENVTVRVERAWQNITNNSVTQAEG